MMAQTERLREVKILLIEDHPIVRDGCRRILVRRAEFKLYEASTAQEGQDLNESVSPAIILLDIELPDSNGLAMIETLISKNNAVKIIIFSMYEASHFIARAMEKGASGYVTKNDEPGLILEAVDKVLSGAMFFSPRVAQNLALANFAQHDDPLRDLNERERQVLKLLGAGKDLTEIANDLSIGYKSAANIVSSIKQKLQIATTPALIKYAVELRAKLTPY